MHEHEHDQNHKNESGRAHDRAHNRAHDHDIKPDATETLRRARLAEINATPGSREALEAQHGKVWSTDELADAFEVIGFMAPLVVVRRLSDGAKGSLEFQHDPRFYFNFQKA